MIDFIIIIFSLFNMVMIGVCLAYLIGNEHKKTEEKPIKVDVKAKEEELRQLRRKKEIEDEQREMDNAIAEFIMRGGLPK